MHLLVAHPADLDPRAPLTPAVAKAWTEKGVTVLVERGVGEHAGSNAHAWTDAGCEIVEHGSAWDRADLAVCVAAPPNDAITKMKRGAVLVGMLGSTMNPALVTACANAGVTTLDLAFVPRTSRAQAMDVLSSQANLAGYKAAVLAAEALPKLMPMMITAAGTLRPSKVFVLGVGVAGLQAIATSKRLGAQVEAFDVRTATKEQVQSLGARFVELDLGEGASAAGGTSGGTSGATSGGYAKELTDEQKQKQTELMHKHMVAADAVIATAAVFGKAPPLLIPQATVDAMKPGSVIVDLAASPDHGRGNCQATQPGQVFTTDRGVTLIGTLNLPATLPVHATQSFAGNVDALLKELITPGSPATPESSEPDADATPATPASLTLDLEDDIQAGCVIIHDGHIRNEIVQNAMA